MPSPFPGMDPWLEDRDVVPDLHDSLIYQIKAKLNHSLPKGYAATSNRIVWTTEDQRRDPDISVMSQQPGFSAAQHQDVYGCIAIAEKPITEQFEQQYIEILDLRGKTLVTAIEILSPSNKVENSDGYIAYKAKQSELISKGANLIEIDLLRYGYHATFVPFESVDTLLPNFSYHIAITIHDKMRKQFVKPFMIDDLLPSIGIPLHPGVQVPILNLQEIIAIAYEDCRYEDLIDYQQPPETPLDPEQQRWAASILQKAGLVTP